MLRLQLLLLSMFSRFLPLWSKCHCFFNKKFHCLSSLLCPLALKKSFCIIIPISFLVFPLFCLSGAWCWGLGSMLLLSLPIVHLVRMQFSFTSAISFFCVMGFVPHLSFQLMWLCFISFIQSNLFHQFLLCQSLHRCLSRKKCCCLVAFSSSEFLWFALLSSSSSFLLSWVFFPSFLFFGRWCEAICWSIVSFFRVPVRVSKCQKRNSASARSPCWMSGICVVRCTILMSSLVCICRIMPNPLWFDFWFQQFPVAEM